MLIVILFEPESFCQTRETSKARLISRDRSPYVVWNASVTRCWNRVVAASVEYLLVMVSVNQLNGDETNRLLPVNMDDNRCSESALPITVGRLA